MAQPKNRPIVLANLATFVVFGALCTAAVLWVRTPDFGKNPPTDPVVAEHLSQARGLQKLGKWEDAAEIIERYAHQGYPRALFHHAKILSRGWGVKPNMEKARLALLRAVQFKFSIARRGGLRTWPALPALVRARLQPDRRGMVLESSRLGL